MKNHNLLKKVGKRWKFEDPKKMRYQLDYILINSKWKNSVMNVKPYSSFASVGSDHRVVTIKLRLSLRMPKSQPPKKRYDWQLLKFYKDMCSRFTLEVRNKYGELYNEDSDATEQYAALMKAKDHAAETILPSTPKGKRDRHSNIPIVQALRKKTNELAHRYAVNQSKVIRKRLQETKNELEQQYKTLEEEYINSLIEGTENEFKASNTAKAWKVVNTIWADYQQKAKQKSWSGVLV